MESTSKRNVLRYFIDALTSPKEAVADFVEKTSFWPMALFMMGINLLLYLPAIPKVKEAAIWALENSQQVPPEQLAMVKKMLPAIVAGQSVFAFLMPLLIWVILTLFFKFCNLFIGSEAPFKKLMSAAVIASAPMVIGNVIKTGLILITPAANMQSISTSAAIILSKPRGFLYGFLSAIDPFLIWTFALLALGAARVLQSKTNKMAVYTAVLWSLYAVGMGVITMFSNKGV